MSFPYPSEDCFNKAEVLVIARGLCGRSRNGMHEVYGGKVELNLFFFHLQVGISQISSLRFTSL